MAKKKTKTKKRVIKKATKRLTKKDNFVVPRAIQATQRIDAFISQHVKPSRQRKWLFTATRQVMEGLRRKGEQR